METEVAIAWPMDRSPRLRKSSVPAIAPAVIVIPPTRELVSTSCALNMKLPEGAAVKAVVSCFSPKPDAVAIEEIVSAAFWASLRREEGKPPKVSLAFVPPEQSAGYPACRGAERRRPALWLAG